MIFNKPKFWDKKISIMSILFLPISLIVLIIIFFKKRIAKPKNFNIPIICVGNIYIGGTGKTPTSILLANELKKIGRNPTIVRKYYKSHTDEHELIREKFNNLILSKNRIKGIKKSQESGYDSVILDDGFQDYSIKKNLNILCFNKNQLTGNGLLLPSGPLREGLNSLRRADVIIINGEKDNKFEEKILKINKNLEIFYSIYNPTNLNEFKNKELLAIAGIGNPENFFKLIEENGLKIKEKLIFPDHYKFSKRDIQKIINIIEKNNYHIIMTEKDYFKAKNFSIKNLNYLRVSLEISNHDKLFKRIQKIYD